MAGCDQDADASISIPLGDEAMTCKNTQETQSCDTVRSGVQLQVHTDGSSDTGASDAYGWDLVNTDDDDDDES